MKIVSRITVHYVAREDRLRLALRERDRDELALWLTRRLSDELVDGLVRVVQEISAPRVATPGIGVVGAEERHSAVNQFWAQSKAEAGMGGSRRKAPADVVRKPEIEELAHRVSLRRVPNEDKFYLEFHWAGDSCVAPVDQIYLRQLLSLFHRNYAVAGWSPRAAWPVWLGNDAHRRLLSSTQIN